MKDNSQFSEKSLPAKLALLSAMALPSLLTSGSGLRPFSGDTEPAGSLVRTARASTSSFSSSICPSTSSTTLSPYSGLLSLARSLPSTSNPPTPEAGGGARQKPLLWPPFPRRLQAGGL